MPGAKSTVARHPARLEIERQLRAGTPATHVARDFDLSRQAVSRFKAKLAARPAGTVDGEREQMLRRVQSLYDGVLGLIQAAHEEKNPNRFLKGIAEARKCLALLARVIGLLNEAPAPPVAVTVNVNVAELKAVILAALVPHPQARIDVAAALERYHDAGEPGGT